MAAARCQSTDNVDYIASGSVCDLETEFQGQTTSCFIGRTVEIIVKIALCLFVLCIYLLATIIILNLNFSLAISKQLLHEPGGFF